MKEPLHRLKDRPFATALAFLLFAGAVTSLLGIGLTADALANLAPNWVLKTLAVAYGIGGLFLLLGMALNKGNVEAAGCVLVGSGLAVRTLALFAVLGFSAPTLSTGMFYVVFMGACAERFRQIVNGDQIIRVHKQIKIKFEGGANDSS